jgi:hypothetical protein
LTAFSGTYLIAVTGNFGFLAPVLAKRSLAVLGLYQPMPAGGDRQWVGGDLVHDRLRPVRRCHDQGRDIASLVRRAGSRGRPRSFAGFRDSSACLDRRLADRDPRQRVSRRRARLGGLSAPADTDRGDQDRTSGRHGVSLSGIYGGMADPLPMMSLFDKQISSGWVRPR